MDTFARVLVVVYTVREAEIRLISAHKAICQKRQQYEEGSAWKQTICGERVTCLEEKLGRPVKLYGSNGTMGHPYFLYER